MKKLNSVVKIIEERTTYLNPLKCTTNIFSMKSKINEVLCQLIHRMKLSFCPFDIFRKVCGSDLYPNHFSRKANPNTNYKRMLIK